MVWQFGDLWRKPVVASKSWTKLTNSDNCYLNMNRQCPPNTRTEFLTPLGEIHYQLPRGRYNDDFPTDAKMSHKAERMWSILIAVRLSVLSFPTPTLCDEVNASGNLSARP